MTSYSPCDSADVGSLRTAPLPASRRSTEPEPETNRNSGAAWRMRASASDLWSTRLHAENGVGGGGGCSATAPRRLLLHTGGSAAAARSPGAETAPTAATAAADAPSRPEADHRHESILSDIGVEYLRTAGAVGRFRQLQRLQNGEWVRESSRSLSPHPAGGGGGGKEDAKGRSTADFSSVVQLPHEPPPAQSGVDGAAPHGSDGALSKSVGGYRLGRKKQLNERRRAVADLCLALAVFGIALMVAETECNLNGLYDKDGLYSFIVKSLISFSTAILLVTTTLYHIVDLQLYLLNNCLEDWRIVLSASRVGLVLAELALCAIHPPPGSGYMTIAVFNRDTRQWDRAAVPIDVILSLPMFSRLYLVVRGLLLHSKLFNDTSSRTIGALNKIKFDARFIIKTLMTICPGKVLSAVLLTIWMLSAWMMRFCESYHDEIFTNYFTAVYMIIITFLSVGYGDIVPVTYCGRGISMATGLVGAGCTALLVAVIANKLELTRAEKLVHSFMMDSQLSKQLKDAAANVLRETWMIYKHTKLVDRINAGVIRLHQRKFLAAIQRLRKVKAQQRKAHDEAMAVMDQGKTQTSVYDGVCDLKQQQVKIQSSLTTVEASLHALELQIKSIQPTLQQWMTERQMSSIYVSMPEVALPESQQSQAVELQPSCP